MQTLFVWTSISTDRTHQSRTGIIPAISAAVNSFAFTPVAGTQPRSGPGIGQQMRSRIGGAAYQQHWTALAVVTSTVAFWNPSHPCQRWTLQSKCRAHGRMAPEWIHGQELAHVCSPPTTRLSAPPPSVHRCNTILNPLPPPWFHHHDQHIITNPSLQHHYHNNSRRIHVFNTIIHTWSNRTPATAITSTHQHRPGPSMRPCMAIAVSLASNPCSPNPQTPARSALIRLVMTSMEHEADRE